MFHEEHESQIRCRRRPEGSQITPGAEHETPHVVSYKSELSGLSA